MKLLNGPVAALVTPVSRNAALDAKKIPKLLRFLFDRGIRGLWACGTSSEVMSLTVEERKRIAEVVVRETASHVPVVVHVGHPVTAVSVELARHARKIGADAVAACAPYPPVPTPEALLCHYRSIAKAAGVPFYVYRIDLLAPVEITVEMVKKMRRRMPLAGVKWSDPDVRSLERLCRIGAGSLNVLGGIDELILPFQLMGADGSVGLRHNAIPETVGAVHRLFSEKKVAQARKVQVALNDLIDAAPANVHIIAWTKELMKLRGLDVGPPRMPTLPLDGKARKAIRAAWERFSSRSSASAFLT